MTGIDNIIVILYLSGVLVLGLVASRGIRTLDNFSVAGRSYSSFIVFATLSASFIGGGFTMGNAEKVFLFGIVNIFALWGFSLKEILVASFFAARMDQFSKAISVGDILGESYGKPAKIVSGFFGVALCAGIVGAQVGAMGYVFQLFLGIDHLWGILIGCGIVIAYSTVGGMKAVVFTDVLQFVLLVIGIPLTLFIGVEHAGGWEAMIESVPADHFKILGNRTLLGFISLFLTFLLGETLVPPYVQRLLIGRTALQTRWGTLWSGLLSIPFFAVTGLIGLVALTLDADLDANLALPFVVKETLPIGLKGLVVAGIISVVMSSADSFLNGAAVACSNDVINPLRREPLSENQQLFLAKAVTVLVGVLAVVFAIKIRSILDILIWAYNFWAPTIVIPMGAALLGVRTSTRVFVAAAAAGLTSALVWEQGFGAPGGVDGLIIGVFFNLIVFLTGYRWERPSARFGFLL
jgi:SSS family solute:Na+ symporter